MFAPDLCSKSAAWQELAKIEDPELKELATLLPTVVFSGRAPSTVKKYSSAFLRWKKWLTQKFEVDCCPAKPLQVSLYLTFLTTKSSTSAPVEEAVNAISWAHQIACTDDPTQSTLAQLPTNQVWCDRHALCMEHAHAAKTGAVASREAILRETTD